MGAQRSEGGHSRRGSLESKQVNHWALKQVAQLPEANRAEVERKVRKASWRSG